MTATDAFGTALQVSDMASTPTFTEVAGVTNIGGVPTVTTNVIDGTAHDSPDGFMEKIPGLRDGGEISLDINWDPEESTHQDVLDLATTASSLTDFKVVFVSDAELDVSGFVSSFENTAPHDDKYTASVTITVSGKPVFTPGA